MGAPSNRPRSRCILTNSHAFRNRERVEERSDFTITPDGGFGRPGVWPGFALLSAGRPVAEIERLLEMPCFHVVLGDGPIMVGFYKQSTVEIYRQREGAVPEEIDLLSVAASAFPADRIGEYEGKWYLSRMRLVDDLEPTLFEVDGHVLLVRWSTRTTTTSTPPGRDLVPLLLGSIAKADLARCEALVRHAKRTLALRERQLRDALEAQGEKGEG